MRNDPIKAASENFTMERIQRLGDVSTSRREDWYEYGHHGPCDYTHKAFPSDPVATPDPTRTPILEFTERYAPWRVSNVPGRT